MREQTYQSLGFLVLGGRMTMTMTMMMMMMMLMMMLMNINYKDVLFVFPILMILLSDLLARKQTVGSS